MEVNADNLKKEIADLKAQRDHALVVFHQATGALALAEMLLTNLEHPAPVGNGADKDAITVDQLRDALGAKSAELILNDDGAA